MIKKFFSLSLIIFSIFPLFADAKNIVYKENFDFGKIESLEISLTYENLQVSRIYGDEIVVEIGSNNRKKIPKVFVQDNALQIMNNNQKARLGDKCTVYIYLPQDFHAQGITIQNVSGNITADILQAQNGVVIGNVSGRTDINACQTELFTVMSVSGNSTLQKVSADYFEFSATSGNIFVELEQAPQATSMISNVSGKSQVYYPKASNFEIIAFSISGSIKTSDSTQKNAGTNYRTIIGAGGPQLSITSVSGRIEFVAY